MYQRIKSASTGLAARRRQYAKEGPIWLEGKKCEPHWVVAAENGDTSSAWINSAPAATEIHHKEGREGKLLLDKTKWLATCRACHVFVEEHGRWAREHGFSI